jgi:tRNA nucleotidyltransferase (CCA-adding enzyme)
MNELQPAENLRVALDGAYPELRTVRDAASGQVYLVGGAVRDLLLGRGRSDLDLVVVGDAAALASALDAEVVEHERFATAKARLDGHEIDLASARTESYPRPGALPEVTPAGAIEADLARRDFTVNAMAIPLDGSQLVDPHDGRADLDAGLLRVLHAASFADDPTRAVRAARYAARFGFRLEPGTEELLRAADLLTVSAERREAELLRLAGEADAATGFGLLGGWGLVDLRPGGVELAARVSELLAAGPWADFAPRRRSILAAALGPQAGERELARAEPALPSAGIELAAGRGPVELALARAMGAEWLDLYLSEWRQVSLEIDGADLIAAGVPEGPAVGRGLAAALRGRLDGDIGPKREEQLSAALEAAGSGDEVE